jgi:DNA repair exonuclease SbcCD ATPase subunit
LKWQEQREFLSTLADGEIDFSDNEDLLELQRKLEQNKEDIVAYKKHLSYRIKEVKEKLKQIPVRLEEQHKALPEKLDWEALQKDYDEIMELCKQKSGEILSIKQGNGGEIERERIRQELRKVQNDIDRIEEKATRCVREARAELDSKINQARSKFSEITRNKADMDSKILSYDSLLRRCNETLERCNEDADEIRRLWSENNKRFDTSEIQTTCPTCGQSLPDYQLQELIENMRTNFNRNQEKVKKQLREKAEVTKKLIADTEKEIESLNNQKAEDLETALRLKNELNEQHKEIVELERTPL